VADQLAAAAAWLAAGLQGSASELVTYARPSTGQSAQLPATYGSTLLRVTDRAGRVKVQRTDRDFVMTAALLVLGGQATTPQRGDTVTLPSGEVFEVTPYESEPAWRWADPFKTMVRAHTKQVSGPS
jgi:hypothetical protein